MRPRASLWERGSSRLRTYILLFAVLVLSGALLATALTWKPAIAPIMPPAAASFPKALVNRGAVLAEIGDCAVCHTAQGGHALAGGRPLPTPFGTLFSTNLTPDAPSGIGAWSFAAFRRAMRKGIRRDGAYLYPAFPYTHFMHVSDADLQALYAYLMSRRPVSTRQPANKLIFPLGFRPILAGWNMLYLRKDSLVHDPAKSREWNRGAYLAEGLGHCGACHTPRNLMGAEAKGHAYAGGLAEGWRAPPLDGANAAAVAWNVDSLTAFLKTGYAAQHGAAGGPMGPVVDSLSRVPDADVHAIAVYIASRMPQGQNAVTTVPSHAAQARNTYPEGAMIFGGACAGCHGEGAPMMGQGRPSLGYATDMRDAVPTNAIQAVLMGLEPPVAGRGPKMPSLASGLTDRQVAQVLAYARARYTDRAPWPDLEKAVRKARKDIQP